VLNSFKSAARVRTSTSMPLLTEESQGIRGREGTEGGMAIRREILGFLFKDVRGVRAGRSPGFIDRHARDLRGGLLRGVEVDRLTKAGAIQKSEFAWEPQKKKNKPGWIQPARL